MRLGYFRSPHWFMWTWTRDGKQEAAIRVETGHRAVTLKYRSRSYGGLISVLNDDPAAYEEQHSLMRNEVHLLRGV
jgi:hypothetical protein